MTRDQSGRVRPLAPGDPSSFGGYRLLGRLGAGGMGIVYLAQRGNGRPVALKVLRLDFADDAELRRRFRREVERTRQVPPFCTAEVLDADPEHDPPYLVVEFIDGPSLRDVVREHGPLAPTKLHGLAIGVASALTAIHAAGVIHRDLKPSNVLLPLGSPKVIDFGIARAVDGEAEHTRHGQVLGTIAYMAPERFGPDGNEAVTPAADVFAWGEVIAYAGTGRTPFGEGPPAVLAARITTQEPQLDGLAGSLRELVHDALAKEPANRPTARELLDRLLGDELLPAARLAGTANRVDAVAEWSQTARLATVPPAFSPLRQSTRPVPVLGRWRHVVTSALALSMLATSGVVAIMMGVIRLPGQVDRDPAAGRASDPTRPATAWSVPAGARQMVSDPLTSEGDWIARDDKPNQSVCAFAGELVVTRQTPGSYRCPGPGRTVRDLWLSVDVTLKSADTCASIWFRFNESGYVLRICQDRFELAIHGRPGPTSVTMLQTFDFDGKVPLDTPLRVGIAADGDNLRFYRNGALIGTVVDESFALGRSMLGIFQKANGASPAYSVSFANIDIQVRDS